MTAIDAAIVELEAHREHVCQVIATLRRFARVVEESHEQPIQVAIAIDGKTIAKTVAKVLPKAIPDFGLSEDALKIRTLILASEDPFSTPEITRMSRLPVDRVRWALKTLVANLDIRATGKTSDRRYTATRLRQGTVAGTQAAPPVGPSPAIGSKTPAFEVSWNGTKERSGEAPTILAPREQKR